MATIKLKDVLPYGLAGKALFDSIKTPLVIYETELADPFETVTLAGQIAAVTGMISTGGLEGLNKADTALRNGYMNNLKPILKDLSYKIKKCIRLGTITDGYASFGLADFKKSISQKDIAGFHLAYATTMARIAATGNTAALSTAGFGAPKVLSITTNHDLAWNVQITKITVKENISDLSKGNQVIVKAMVKSIARILKAGRAYAESIGDTTLMRKCTQKALLATVTPTVPVGSVDRSIAENTSKCWLKTPVARDLMKFTLLTEGGEVYICRMDLMTGICTAGLLLVFGETLEVKKMDVPGSGDKIIITNAGVGKVVVRTERVKG